jgi:hypothetical protein
LQDGSGSFAISEPQFHIAFYLPQGITLGAISAQPEVLDCFVFGLRIFGMKAKKSASIKSHQRLGTLRIGTLRDHESVAAAYVLDVT